MKRIRCGSLETLPFLGELLQCDFLSTLEVNRLRDMGARSGHFAALSRDVYSVGIGSVLSDFLFCLCVGGCFLHVRCS